MRVDDLFPPEVIDEDIRKAIGGAALGAALFAAPMSQQAHEPAPHYSAEDVSILADTIWAEARNQGEDGMRAVGHVIKNRAAAHKPKLFGVGIKGVALKPEQFSCWNANDPNQPRLAKMQQIDQALKTHTAPVKGASFDDWNARFEQSSLYKDYQMWQQAREVAKKVLFGGSRDPTDGAQFYHTTAVRPAWADKLNPVTKIADHIFYRNQPRKG